MKKKGVLIVAALLLVSQGLFAASRADAIVDAQTDATVDGQSYSAFMNGLGAFGLSLLISPLLGGGISIALAYIPPQVVIPASRLAIAQDKYKDSDIVLVYKTQYEDSLSKAERDKNAAAAWTGTGLAFGLLLVIILSAY